MADDRLASAFARSESREARRVAVPRSVDVFLSALALRPVSESGGEVEVARPAETSSDPESTVAANSLEPDTLPRRHSNYDPHDRVVSDSETG